MKRIIIYSIIFALLIIPIGAYIDAILIENTDFKGYLIVCTIEAFIFISGMLWANAIIKNDAKDENTEGVKE